MGFSMFITGFEELLAEILAGLHLDLIVLDQAWVGKPKFSF